MNDQEIKSILIQLLKKTAPDTEPEELNETANFRAELGMDSFDFLQFMVAVNEQLNIEIPEQDYAAVSTLKDLTDYILAKKV
ncbi:MAG: acyl carrier protein [Sphingobacteriales bacterium]|nr:acyl carrier protein [Sphingobacteriales bacterium]